MHYLKAFKIFGLLALILVVSPASSTFALSSAQKKVIQSGISFFDVDVAADSCSGSLTPSPGGSSVDYAGTEILNSAQLASIAANSPTYQAAAKQVNIPWQLLAVVHLKEHNLLVDNPGNGQGIYQFVDKHGGPYPTGPVDQPEFLRQTILAAEFLKNKVNSNYEANREMTEQSGPEVIKDTLFSYNGRSSAYSAQAASLGYDSATQGYEGSPYVMNKADAARDPNVSPTTWGQVKKDHGPIEYPANQGYGTFVVYASLANIGLGCSNSGGSLTWPEEHTVAVTSCFGPRIHPVNGGISTHYGLDMSGGEGTPILAAAAGTVTVAGPASGYGPNFVVIKHNEGLSTGYGHMKSKSVAVGDTVTQGQQIGEEGNEGIGTGSHLHFNVIPGDYKGSDRSNVNPLQNGLTIPEDTTNLNGCK